MTEVVPNPNAKRILLIDDDVDCLAHCSFLLKSPQYNVSTTTSPVAALEFLKTEPFDLLVVDINMPDMNGFTFLEKLKVATVFSGAVLMLTSRRTASDVRQALSLGANDYVCKPIRRDVFLERVTALLSNTDPPSKVCFAPSSSISKAEIFLPAKIAAICDVGIFIRAHHPIKNDLEFVMDSPVFKEIGIAPPALQVFRWYAITNDPDYPYEIIARFRQLDPISASRLKQWLKAYGGEPTSEI